MLITLFGPDSYRRIKKLNGIIETYREKYTGLSYERIDMSIEGSLPHLKRFIENRSIFDPIRLVVLDSPLETENEKELRTLLKSVKENKAVTAVLNSSNKPSATYKFLYEEPSVSQEFPAIKEPELNKFITQVAEEHKLKLDTKTKTAILQLFGSDTWGIATEINRLSLSKSQEVEWHGKTDYYELINTLKRGYTTENRLVALEIILSDRKDDPARVFNSLAYKLNSKEEATRYANYDVLVKSGKLEYEEVLLDLAIRR